LPQSSQDFGVSAFTGADELKARMSKKPSPMILLHLVPE